MWLQSLALLMQGVLHKHRLSILALGHRHAMGLDGVPFDQDMAYSEWAACCWLLLFTVVYCCLLLFVVVYCCLLLFVVVYCCLLLFAAGVVYCCLLLFIVVVYCCLLLFVVVVYCCLLLFTAGYCFFPLLSGVFGWI